MGLCVFLFFGGERGCEIYSFIIVRAGKKEYNKASIKYHSVRGIHIFASVISKILNVNTLTYFLDAKIFRRRKKSHIVC